MEVLDALKHRGAVVIWGVLMPYRILILWPVREITGHLMDAPATLGLVDSILYLMYRYPSSSKN